MCVESDKYVICVLKATNMQASFQQKIFPPWQFKMEYLICEISVFLTLPKMKNMKENKIEKLKTNIYKTGIEIHMKKI